MAEVGIVEVGKRIVGAVVQEIEDVLSAPDRRPRAGSPAGVSET
ncbi:hypothetical protein ACH4SK_37625 [Streptomyces inhibens]